MAWSTVSFGKWAKDSLTLPQILVKDPDWFFWAVEQDAFAKSKRLSEESATLARRAKSIKIPPGRLPADRVRYWFTHQGQFSHIELIASDEPAHMGSSTELRLKHLDLSAPRRVKQYDKLGGREILGGFKRYWFDGKHFTKVRVEAFFSDPANFTDP